MPLPEPFVLHCHIPKTGGSALNQRLLFPRYGKDRVLQMYRFVFERSSRLPLRHRTRAMRVFAAAGHVPFGYADRLYPQTLYISVFRDPVDRFLSFLNFVLATPDHAVRAHLPAELLNADAADDLVLAVLADPKLARVHGDTQTRLAAGMARLGDVPAGADHLAVALLNLDNPRYLVGAQHDLDGFLKRTAHRLPSAGKTGRLREKVAPRLAKRGPGLIRAGALGTRAHAAIEDANRLDMALWERVLARVPAPAADAATNEAAEKAADGATTQKAAAREAAA